jgi:hypothetical protein
MASAYSPIWMRCLHQGLPFLFKTCLGGNKHWRWDRLCWCAHGEHFGLWHGGIYDFKTKREYQLCEQCRRSRER